MAQLRAVLFDVDGTLVDSNAAHARAWADALREYGYDVPFERVLPLIGMGGDKLLPEVSGIEKASDLGKLGKLLKVAQIDDLVEAATSSSDAKASKPDPDIVQAAIDKLGCRVEDVIMVGDTPYDVEASHRAGMRIIGVRCGGWDDEGLRGAAAIYDSPADLLARYDQSPLADQ